METRFSHHGLWDTHMHSQFSGDSEAPQEEMISSAIEKGLAGICFTDHLDIDYPEEPDIFFSICQIILRPYLPIRKNMPQSFRYASALSLAYSRI